MAFDHSDFLYADYLDIYIYLPPQATKHLKKCNFSAIHIVLQKVLNYRVISSIKMRSHGCRHMAITSQSQLTCHNQVPWSKMRLDRSSSRVMLFFVRTSIKETTPVKTVARARTLCKKMSTTTRPWVWLYMIKADRRRKTVCHTMGPRAIHSFSLPLSAHCHDCFFKTEHWNDKHPFHSSYIYFFLYHILASSSNYKSENSLCRMMIKKLMGWGTMNCTTIQMSELKSHIRTLVPWEM